MGYLNPIQLAALIITGLLLVVADAHSLQGTTWGEYNVGSRHNSSGYTDKFGQHHKWNENNTGAGISYEVTNYLEVGGGFFKNSYSIRTVYAGIDLHTSRAKWLSAGISVGPMMGYENTPTPHPFMILPNIVIGTDKLRTKIGYIPGDVSVMTLTIGVGF